MIAYIFAVVPGSLNPTLPTDADVIASVRQHVLMPERSVVTP
jgi:hypothetical protein